jgi:recombination protein RecR
MYPKAVQEAINQIAKLPGLGRKSAERLALHLVRAPEPEVRVLAKSLARLKQEVCTCSQCFNLSDSDPCSICADPARDPGLLCVVESPADLAAMEAAGSFKGRYFVLAGPLSPLEGMGPEQLRLDRLLARARQNQVQEVIIATNPTTEGEATANLLAQALENTSLLVSRLGYGMPVGGDLKYMDGQTLARSLESRRKVD